MISEFFGNMLDSIEDFFGNISDWLNDNLPDAAPWPAIFTIALCTIVGIATL